MFGAAIMTVSALHQTDPSHIGLSKKNGGCQIQKTDIYVVICLICVHVWRRDLLLPTRYFNVPLYTMSTSIKKSIAQKATKKKL